ncbi:DUF3810 domain-containing protein [Tenacibaculum sp. SG-28]|uniref:DUF3810 domain-containing protein n=1 Tax=Tenacibaculum sp. SG-28 TaxID=754426 RepID=UPI000CF3E0BC|nr:DUF3810 domain-containing protein [Tenacibaculum sp. SG-28]PQJ23568.1 hypothetical protein BSU00_03745 [Tenacibaculum sp. SG-28]
MNSFKRNLLIALLLPIQILIVRCIGTKTAWIEHYYSNGIYIPISKTLRFLFGWIPFSVGDVLGLILLFLLLKNICNLIASRFKNILPKTINFIAVLSLLHFVFYLFWGLNYFREPLYKSLEFSKSKYSTEQLFKVTKKIATNFNEVHQEITNNDSVAVKIPISRNLIYKLAPQGFENLVKIYPQLSYSNPSVKSSLVSLFQSYNGTSGYFNPISGEAQVNHQIPITSYPATTCHEIAHQIGWAAENEANFIGFLACIHHDNLYFKYAGYRMAFQYCIGELQKRDANLATQIKRQINRGIFKDYKNTYSHWKKYENPIEPYIKKGYNSYLKANNQSKGIKSYNYVVDLLIAYYN